MKKILYLTALMLWSFSATAQYETINWDVFATARCSLDPFWMDDVSQNHIKVKQVENRFFWGDDNYYDVYNKNEEHKGFMTITTWDFIDKYKQRGQLIYQHNQNADWATRHMLYIFYENEPVGMIYLSNEPKKN